MGGVDLSEISIGDLMAEVERRLRCQEKPEKRVVLVGKSTYILLVQILIHCGVARRNSSSLGWREQPSPTGGDEGHPRTTAFPMD